MNTDIHAVKMLPNGSKLICNLVAVNDLRFITSRIKWRSTYPQLTLYWLNICMAHNGNCMFFISQPNINVLNTWLAAAQTWLSVTNTITSFQKTGSRRTANSLGWAVCVMSAFSWICLNGQNKAIQRSVLIGMVYNSRQLLYIQKSHNTGNTGGLVYIIPWSNVELANFCSEGLLPRFGSYCTYTRNEILAKKCEFVGNLL